MSQTKGVLVAMGEEPAHFLHGISFSTSSRKNCSVAFLNIHSLKPSAFIFNILINGITTHQVF